MKKYINLNLIFKISFVLIAACLTILNISVYADTIRRPVYAGSFYPAKASELEQTIDRLTDQSKQTQVKIPPHKFLKALILPHAGYIYSGLTAAHSGSVLSEKQFSKVILMGPDHRIGFINCAVSDVDAYQTPLGAVRLHKDAAGLRLASDMFRPIFESDRAEHSLEVVLPFLQRYLKEFELVPIVTGSGDYNKLAAAIEPVINNNTLLVASSDLSHYLSYSEAVARDKETLKIILNLESDKLLARDNCACGKIPILIIISMAKKYGWQPVLLHYSNSGDTAGGRTKVVGYAAIAFYGDLLMENKSNAVRQFSEKQGHLLVKLARRTIMEKLGQKMDKTESEKLDEALKDLDFQVRRGTFVTLNIDDQLRGCVGSLTGSELISDNVRDNAINAAFRDFRFNPLTIDELKDVDIEISILTEPKPLEYTDGADLIAKLRVNVDGVIIRKGHAGATFLPQVWEQLPRPEEFLSHLCLKAGMSADAWQKTRLEVMTYQVQYFEE